jgi:hypothetical protein
MKGFGFLDYNDPLDARDFVPGMSIIDHSCVNTQ